MFGKKFMDLMLESLGGLAVSMAKLSERIDVYEKKDKREHERVIEVLDKIESLLNQTKTVDARSKLEDILTDPDTGVLSRKRKGRLTGEDK